MRFYLYLGGASVAGVVLGSGVTYLILKKRYDKRLDEEIASVKEVYSKKKQSVRVSEEVEEDVEDVDDTNHIVVLSDTFQKNIESAISKYTTGLFSGDDSVIVPETLPIFPEPDDEVPGVKVYPDIDGPAGGINHISQDEFFDKDGEYSHYTKVRLHYYAGDDVFATEDRELMMHGSELVGKKAHNLLLNWYTDGLQHSEGGDCIYIRNHRVDVEYEIYYEEDRFM